MKNYPRVRLDIDLNPYGILLLRPVYEIELVSVTKLLC
jgi:hypothetical protein